MLRAAVTEFLAHGYDFATTADIAKAAGMTPSSFFRAFENKEALLLKFVEWIFTGQYDLARRISGTDDPMITCAVEGALEIHTAELTEQLRNLYVAAYSLPTTSTFIYRVMSQRLFEVFSPLIPHAKAKDFYEMEIASASMIRGYMAVPCDMYFTIEAKITRFLDCALKIYNTEEKERKRIIDLTLSMDLHSTAENIVGSTLRKVESGEPIAGRLIY